MPARAARRAKAAPGIEQKDAGRDDLLALLQAVSNLHAVGKLHADSYGPRLETITGSHEHVLLQAGIDHRITWHGQDVLSSHLKRRGAIQAGLQHARWVCDREA